VPRVLSVTYIRHLFENVDATVSDRSFACSFAPTTPPGLRARVGERSTPPLLRYSSFPYHRIVSFNAEGHCNSTSPSLPLPTNSGLALVRVHRRRIKLKERVLREGCALPSFPGKERTLCWDFIRYELLLSTIEISSASAELSR